MFWEYDEISTPLDLLSIAIIPLKGGDFMKYVRPAIDTFSLEDLLAEVEARATTSAHCSHCYTKYA